MVVEPLEGEAGTGLVATLFGVTVILVLLLFAVQVLFDLYARSAVSAVAVAAARRVAGYDLVGLGPDALSEAQAQAEARARAELGRYGAHATFAWSVSSTDVALRVHVQSESLLPRVFAAPLGLDTIDRSAHVDAENLVCPPQQLCQPASEPSS